MAKNLTPAHLRCGGDISSCPSVHELEDGSGDLLIVGKWGEAVAVAYGIPVGHDEQAIIIDRELLANLSPWQPISTAPKDGTPVDLWIVPSGISSTGPGRCPDCWHSNGKWWRYDEAFGDGECKSEVANATHWQPLPLPPEGSVAAGAALHPGAAGAADFPPGVQELLGDAARGVDPGILLSMLRAAYSKSQIEEAGTADEVSAASTSASLTPKE